MAVYRQLVFVNLLAVRWHPKQIGVCRNELFAAVRISLRNSVCCVVDSSTFFFTTQGGLVANSLRTLGLNARTALARLMLAELPVSSGHFTVDAGGQPLIHKVEMIAALKKFYLGVTSQTTQTLGQ